MGAGASSPGSAVIIKNPYDLDEQVTIAVKARYKFDRETEQYVSFYLKLKDDGMPIRDAFLRVEARLRDDGKTVSDIESFGFNLNRYDDPCRMS